MTREEAIMNIKKVLPMSKTLEEAFYTLHPELCESEDERIRKEIIEFIQWSEDRGMTHHDFHQAKRPSEWITWLENQKQSFKQISDNVIWDSGLRTGIELGKKEQKPTEWSKEDEEMLDLVIFDILQAKRNSDDEYFKELCDKEIAWLKALPLSLKKKNEDVAKLCSNEWSKEEKKMINHLIEALPMWANGQIAMLPSIAEEYVELLKSLCPPQYCENCKLKHSVENWKPSKEQMEALEYFIRSWGESGTMSPQNPILCAANSLLINLKKLI